MTYFELAQEIDRGKHEFTRCEASLLERVLISGPRATLTDAQQRKLRELGEAYLGRTVMAEFNGQQRLPL